MKIKNSDNLIDNLISYSNEDKVNWKNENVFLNGENLNKINTHTFEALNVLDNNARDKISKLLDNLGKTVIPHASNIISNALSFGENKVPRNIYDTYVTKTEFNNFANNSKNGEYKYSWKAKSVNTIISPPSDSINIVNSLPEANYQWLNHLVSYKGEYYLCKLNHETGEYFWNKQEPGITTNTVVEDNKATNSISELLQQTIKRVNSSTQYKYIKDNIPTEINNKLVASTEFVQYFKEYLIQKIVAPIKYEETVDDRQICLYKQGSVVTGYIKGDPEYADKIGARDSVAVDLGNCPKEFKMPRSFADYVDDYADQYKEGAGVVASIKIVSGTSPYISLSAGRPLRENKDIYWTADGFPSRTPAGQVKLNQIIFGYRVYLRESRTWGKWKINSMSSCYSILPSNKDENKITIEANGREFDTFYFGKAISATNGVLLVFGHNSQNDEYLGIPTYRSLSPFTDHQRGVFGVYKITDFSIQTVDTSEKYRVFNFLKDYTTDWKKQYQSFNKMVESGHFSKWVEI